MAESFLPRAAPTASEEVEQDASAGELLEQDEAEGGEDEVGGPDAEEGRELAGLGEGDADDGEDVVGEDEQQGEDEAGAFAAAFGGEAEGHADEHEDEAGEGIGEAGVELDAGGADVGGGDGVAGEVEAMGALPEFAERRAPGGGC